MELPLGALCRSCITEIERNAARWGNLVSLVTTILVATYFYFFRRTPDPTARMLSAMAIVIWFALSNIVVRRAVRELTK